MNFTSEKQRHLRIQRAQYCSSNDGQGGRFKRGTSAHPNLVGNLQLFLKSLQLGIPQHPFSLQKIFHDVKCIVYAEEFVSFRFIFAV